MNNCFKTLRLVGAGLIALSSASAAYAQVTVSPTAISVQITQGTNAPSQTVSVSNSGNRSWSITKSNSWFNISPTSGKGRSTVTISFATSNFGPGTYNEWFTVTGSSTVVVPVQVVVAGTTGTGTVAPPPPPPPPPPPASGVGPQSTITCPSGAVNIYPGTGIQGLVDTNPGNTTFCLRAGTHYLYSSITPKTGDTFVGEYGAALDGSGWSTSDDTQAAFRAHNQDINYVTIRNLVIRNMPQRGIHAYYYMADHWTIEYNEIAYSKNIGLVFPSDSTIRNNNIHHSSFGGYMAPSASNTTLEGNEIAYNGSQQKVMESANVTFRNNFVHHNVGAGIWFDSDNTNALVEGNRVEDNGTNGIWFEIGSGIIIRNNTIRRSADTAVFISTSKNAQVYSNTLENNFRGVTYFVNCPSVGQGAISFDLANNTTHDNSITVGTQTYAFASVFNYSGCTSTQVAPYLNGSKGLTFTNNTYKVPSTSGQYWYWSVFKYWYEWQGLGLDTGGSVSQ